MASLWLGQRGVGLPANIDSSAAVFQHHKLRFSKITLVLGIFDGENGELAPEQNTTASHLHNLFGSEHTPKAHSQEDAQRNKEAPQGRAFQTPRDPTSKGGLHND